MSEFVHLRVHTEYSLLDGACTIEKLCSQVVKLGQCAVAITDKGCMFGVVEFYNACVKNNIKPIIGIELEFESYSIVLLCQDNVGYQNLIKLASYDKPNQKELIIQHCKGLIAILSYSTGDMVTHITSELQYMQAKEVAIFYKNVFKDQLYIELLCEEPKLIWLSKEVDIEVVATNNVYYIEKEQSKIHKMLNCIRDNESYTLPQNSLFYLKTTQEMVELYTHLTSAVTNSVKIAEHCNVTLDFNTLHLPSFNNGTKMSNDEYFLGLCYGGLKQKYDDNNVAKDRLEYEVSVIKSMGYVDYFLIVADFVNYAKENDIPVGPGRGSGVGSIAAYCIGITDIDPLQYNLIFERFLNPERVSMPDFDIDFCFERRVEVINYVIKKYGVTHVCQIATFGTMAAKAVIRDVGRALSVNNSTVDLVAHLIPFKINVTIDDAMMGKELHQLYDKDPVVRNLIDVALQLEGYPRHLSTHAAGVVITKEPVSYYVPTIQGITQYNMINLEQLGLLKMDFLGLRTLTVIDKCCKMIKGGLKIKEIPLNDKNVFNMLSTGDSSGVFQFESKGMRQFLVSLKPNCIEDLIAATSIYRPGPIEQGTTNVYVKNRHNPKAIQYKTELLRPILKPTFGCIVYQEQVMQIFRELGGYSYGGADLVRRAMSKKKTDVMEKERGRFIVGCINNCISKEVANELFDDMASFASYAFNKSHAAAYATVAYQTAYLKCHHKYEFFAALLTSVIGKENKLSEYLSEAKINRIKILKPNINQSFCGFIPLNDGILYGLSAIKSLSVNACEWIVEQRNLGGEYTSPLNFIERTHEKVAKRSLQMLIEAGTFDIFGITRDVMLSSYEELYDKTARHNRANIDGQLDLFAMPKKTLYLKLYKNDENLGKLIQILEKHKGDSRVIFYFENIGKYMEFKRFRVELSGILMTKLQNLDYIKDIVDN